MNRNVVIVMAGGFLIAILVALLVQASLGGRKKAEPVKQEAQIEIAVAGKPLKIGQELKDGDVKWQSWPQSGMFPGAIKRKADEKAIDAVHGRLKRAIAEGEPMQQSALTGETKSDLSAMLDPGMRAITVAVDPVAQVGGFAEPGDFVDVILSYRQRVKLPGMSDNTEVQKYVNKSIDSYATETILEHVKVLAVDQSMKRPEDDKIKAGKTVTLQVDKKGAETLALSRKLGTLTLALRSLGDEKTPGQTYPIVTDARVTNIYREVEQGVAKENIAGKKPADVRIYSGEAVQDLPVNQ